MGYSFTSPSLKERLSQRRVEDKGASTPLNRCLGLPSLVVQGLSHMLGAGKLISRIKNFGSDFVDWTAEIVLS